VTVIDNAADAGSSSYAVTVNAIASGYSAVVQVIPYKTMYTSNASINRASDLAVYKRDPTTGGMIKLGANDFTVDPSGVFGAGASGSPRTVTVAVANYPVAGVNTPATYSVWVDAPTVSVTPALSVVPLKKIYAAGSSINTAEDLAVFKASSNGTTGPVPYALSASPGYSLKVDAKVFNPASGTLTQGEHVVTVIDNAVAPNHAAEVTYSITVSAAATTGGTGSSQHMMLISLRKTKYFQGDTIDIANDLVVYKMSSSGGVVNRLFATASPGFTLDRNNGIDPATAGFLTAGTVMITVKDTATGNAKAPDVSYTVTVSPNTESCIVMFNANGGTEPPLEIVNWGACISPPSSNWAGYTITGWYKEPECITPWNFASDIVTENITLYAHWVKDYNRAVSWTDVSGVRHYNVPTSKHQWYTGEVLEYQRATKGAGVDIVIVNDAFNKKEMEVGGVWDTTAIEIAELFFKMPVIRDYREYFNIYILMRVSPKSGLFRLYNNNYVNLARGPDIFGSLITAMPQIGPGKGETVSVIAAYNGFAGGFMTKRTYPYAVYQFCTSEPNFPGWMMHEFMGHAFTAFGDQYLAPSDITLWSFVDESMGWQPPVTPITRAPAWRWAANCHRAKWDDEGWRRFIDIPGNAQYAANEAKYKQLSTDWNGNPIWIWQNRTAGNCMRNTSLQTDAWDRFLMYQRIMELAGEPYSIVDFLGNDQQYINITDWRTALGVENWRHSYPLHDPSHPDTYAAWDDE
jgi:uncharacterized repeat protein (TIGR02543 family)